MVKESLSEIYERHAVHGDFGHGDKGSLHSYIPEYERLLAPYRILFRPSFLEIGLAMGKSMDMWCEYFSTNSDLIGADITIVFDPARFEGRARIIEADATKPAFMEAIADTTFNVIIDDGSHMQADQEATFRMLAPRMRPGGIYVIEDILNLELSGPALRALHPNCEVIDLRNRKGRFDDVLLVYRF